MNEQQKKKSKAVAAAKKVLGQRKRRRGTYRCKETSGIPIEMIEVFDDDPADWDALLEMIDNPCGLSHQDHLAHIKAARQPIEVFDDDLCAQYTPDELNEILRAADELVSSLDHDIYWDHHPHKKDLSKALEDKG